MSLQTLKVKDETNSGKTILEMDLLFSDSTVTVKDIIEARVNQEVKNYNERSPEYFHGLVRPTHAEVTLNGLRMKDRQKIDAEKQIYTALNAFQKNAYFVLIDDKQAESLDTEVHLKSDTVVSFIRLTPLVGG